MSKTPETEYTKLNILVLGGFFLRTIEKARSTTSFLAYSAIVFSSIRTKLMPCLLSIKSSFEG